MTGVLVDFWRNYPSYSSCLNVFENVGLKNGFTESGFFYEFNFNITLLPEVSFGWGEENTFYPSNSRGSFVLVKDCEIDDSYENNYCYWDLSTPIVFLS